MRRLREWGIRILIAVAVGTLGLLGGPMAVAQSVFNCPDGFTSTTPAACSFANGFGQAGYNFGGNAGVLSGSNIVMTPVGATHGSTQISYLTAPVNVQGFTTTFTWTPGDISNLALVFNNCIQPGCGSGQGKSLSAGAGCEGGFSQSYGNPPFINNTFAVMLDLYSPLTESGPFTYSSVQVYQPFQSPCLPPNGGQPDYYPTNKLSTAPVNLTNGTQGVPTEDMYSVTVTYSGNTLTLSMFNVTTGGSCPGASCFTNTWNGVYIPAIVGGKTAYVQFSEGIGLTTSIAQSVNGWSYTVNSPTAGSGLTSWNENSTSNNGRGSAASPVYSVTPGSYTETQSVAITSSTPGAYICYELSSSYPTQPPQPDNKGGCNAGTPYSGPVPVSSSTTLYAMAGIPYTASNVGPPSTLVAGAYTIGSIPAASTPTFSPVAGTYTGSQSVIISDATSGATIYYTADGSTPTTSSTQYTGPIAVSSTEKIEAVAVDAGDTRSAVASATYAITSIGVGVGSPMTCLPLQSVPGSPGTLQTACTIVLTP